MKEDSRFDHMESVCDDYCSDSLDLLNSKSNILFIV